jgi:hypothetical protein
MRAKFIVTQIAILELQIFLSFYVCKMVSYFHLLIFGKYVILVVGLCIGQLSFLYILGYAFFGSCVEICAY